MIVSISKQQRKTFYRSIQYRSVSTEIKSIKQNLQTEKIPQFKLRNCQSTRNQKRYPTKMLFRSEQNVRQLGKSLCQTMKQNKNEKMDQTLANLANPQEQFQSTYKSNSYLETFGELMQFQSKTDSPLYRNIGPFSKKLKAIRQNVRIDRISLPNIIEYENSQYTALDAISIPIEGIKQHITRVKKQIVSCPNDLLSISCQMKTYAQAHIRQIDSFSSQFMHKLENVRKKLTQDTVFNQGLILVHKRQIRALQSFLPPFKKQFHNQHQRQKLIQGHIFQTHPFQLDYQKNYIEEQNNQQELNPNKRAKQIKLYQHYF